MEEVRVLLHFGAPIEQTFAAVSDHEHFLSDERSTARIVQPGADERNGLGCVREIRGKMGGGAIVEEITAWDRPTSFEYRIRKAPIPVRHEGGSVRFTPKNAGTDVEWTTKFAIPVPVVGRVVEKVLARTFRGVFKSLLTAARAKLEGE